jgi:hypothetical protein
MELAGRLGASAGRAPRSGSLRLLRRGSGVVPRPAAAPGVRVRGPVAALVTFSVKRKVAFGEHLRVVGNVAELGAWNPSSAPALSWNDGDVWTGSVELSGDASFKFVVFGGDGDPLWEEGDDRKLAAGDQPAGVTTEWHGSAKRTGKNRRSNDGDGGGDSSGRRSVAAADELVLAMAGADGRWQGKEVTFMKANEHSGSRRGGWKPEGLSGAAQRLVEGDMCAPRAHKPPKAVLGPPPHLRGASSASLTPVPVPRRRSGSWLQKLESVAGLVGVDKSQARAASS